MKFKIHEGKVYFVDLEAADLLHHVSSTDRDVKSLLHPIPSKPSLSSKSMEISSKLEDFLQHRDSIADRMPEDDFDDNESEAHTSIPDIDIKDVPSVDDTSSAINLAGISMKELPHEHNVASDLDDSTATVISPIVIESIPGDDKNQEDDKKEEHDTISTQPTLHTQQDQEKEEITPIENSNPDLLNDSKTLEAKEIEPMNVETEDVVDEDEDDDEDGVATPVVPPPLPPSLQTPIAS